MYDSFVERLSRDTGINVGYARSGSLQVVTGEESLDELRAVAAAARAAGVECELLDADAVKAAEPQLTPDAAGAADRHARICRARRSQVRIGRRHQTRRAHARPCASAAHHMA
jgi:L-2-hydroxyglutarate oxidase LhgO